MNVALTFPGCHRRGGVERVILECANFLAARGHEVSVIASSWDEKALATSVHRHRVGSSDFPRPLDIACFAWQSRRALHRLSNPPDIVGSFGVQSPTDGVLWIQSVHRAWIEICRRQRPFIGRMKQRMNPFHPMILAFEKHYIGGRRYRKLIALTEQVRADLMEYYDVPSQDIVVIPNGFSPTEFNPTRCATVREPMRQKLGYRPTDRVVVFVANELDRKGFFPLLRAMAELKDPSLKLLVVGRLNSASTKPVLDQLGMSKQVTFTGPANDVAMFYAAADAFALPTYYEAWGLVIVEAMACGLPVLTSRLAGASVAVQEGVTGLLLDDPRDPSEIKSKLVRLLSTRCVPPEQIAASVTSYAWDHLLPSYEQVLQENATQPSPVQSQYATC